ncbi:MAG: prenyltransferase/squalene oxidase repeat-containing protein [Planctomycetota bacterium]
MKRVLLAAAALGIFGSGVWAFEPADGSTSDAGPSAQRDLPREAEEAIQAGVAFLVRAQNSDGSWLSDGSTGRYPVAMTALAGLALLASGNTCYSGAYAGNVRAAVEFLLQHADPETGLIATHEAGRPMFGHGFAMLFLAEAYGSEGQTTLQRRIHAALTKAVELTARTQSDLGGWYYTPDSDQDEGAVTVTQMQGLRGCASAGIPVPPQTVERALGYIHRSANSDGGIAYRAGEPGDSRPGITCAALATMYAAGMYEDELVENALRYARDNVPLSAPRRAGGTHFFYSHLYLSQVMYFRGRQDWRDYFSGIRAWLLEVRNDDGSWEGDYIGRTYGTSVALLILQLPYNNLPVLQR